MLERCRWILKNEELNLGKFSALPYMAKPVKDFREHSDAWHIIQTCLEIMINEDKQPEGDDWFFDKLAPDMKRLLVRQVEEKLDH